VVRFQHLQGRKSCLSNFSKSLPQRREGFGPRQGFQKHDKVKKYGRLLWTANQEIGVPGTAELKKGINRNK